MMIGDTIRRNIITCYSDEYHRASWQIITQGIIGAKKIIIFRYSLASLEGIQLYIISYEKATNWRRDKIIWNTKCFLMIRQTNRINYYIKQDNHRTKWAHDNLLTFTDICFKRKTYKETDASRLDNRIECLHCEIYKAFGP
jgi:hypothetical protein